MGVGGASPGSQSGAGVAVLIPPSRPQVLRPSLSEARSLLFAAALAGAAALGCAGLVACAGHLTPAPGLQHPDPRFGCTETPTFLGIYCLSPPRTPPPILANKRPSRLSQARNSAVSALFALRLLSGPIRRRVEAANRLAGS
ncbi:hypothetical protein HPG69_018236 [Diceros bicornis minor]|uniref:Uncharacterized protein n=1 Tax=Diceros bicornis minor TaxID=77932 RepID=A0A7J7E3R9_DICBM|nr:hypothetical protein HPG69_018236 [Diceros bicornis minor]